MRIHLKMNVRSDGYSQRPVRYSLFTLNSPGQIQSNIPVDSEKDLLPVDCEISRFPRSSLRSSTSRPIISGRRNLAKKRTCTEDIVGLDSSREKIRRMEKHQHIRAFIAAALEYSKHNNENTSSVLQRNLGVLGASLDQSVFDPGSTIANEFYISLYELMNTLASRTSLIWSTVAVLEQACRNTAARHALIHTYKFAPILMKLLQANLTAEKRTRVLKLLQELTYGIKISWQDAHLPHLMSTLTEWVTKSTQEEVVALSLGVLVNLCYKNLPAVYTLMRTIETKVFVRQLLKICSSNINTKVQCCKLLIILEHINKEIPEGDILDFATVTFSSLVSALRDKDVILLRHIVDFFNDVRQNERSRAILVTYPHYFSAVENILATLESNSDPECVALIMEFLLSLIKLQLPSLVALYQECIKTAMTWVPVEQVCSKALALIRTVVIDTRSTRNSMDVLASLDLSVLMLVLDDDSMERSAHSAETQLRLTELLQLLQELARLSDLRPKVLQIFSEQAMSKLLRPIIDQAEASMGDSWPGNLFQDPSTTLFVHALSLTADLAPNDTNWLKLYRELLGRKQIQMVIALAIFTGDSEVRLKALQLTSSVGFSQECLTEVIHCMGELQSLLLVQGPAGMASAGAGSRPSVHYNPCEMVPPFSLAQEGHLDVFIAKLQEAFDSNQIGDITTSAIMELYEYKLTAMRRAERATQASLEAADNHATSLQHRLAQVIAESSKLHQLLFYTQQCLEGIQVEKSTLDKRIKEIETQSATQAQEIRGLKTIVIEKSNKLEELAQMTKVYKNDLQVSTERNEKLNNELMASDARNKELSSKNHELSKLLNKMQETLTKREQQIEEQKKEMASNKMDISALKQEIQQLESLGHVYERKVTEKDETIQKLRGELTDLSRLRDMIFDLTAKQRDDGKTT